MSKSSFFKRLMQGTSLSWRDDEVAERYLQAGAERYDIAREAHEHGYRFWSRYHYVMSLFLGRLYHLFQEDRPNGR